MLYFFTGLLVIFCQNPFPTLGDVIDVYVGFAPVDDTPIFDATNPHSSFSGFRIAPE